MLVGLKNVGSFRDCTLCNIMTKVPIDKSLSEQAAKQGQLDPGVVGKSEFDLDPTASQPSLRVAGSRDPAAIIEAALVVAKSPNVNFPHKDNWNKRQKMLSKSQASAYLASMSANNYPPAIAAFPGMYSGPARLYKSVAFNVLHAMDLGTLRIIPERTCELFARSEYSAHGRKAALLRTVKQRFLELPYGAKVTRRAIFLSNGTEVLAGMTGKVRRDSLPFLWVVLI